MQYGDYQLYLGAYQDRLTFPVSLSNRTTATEETRGLSAELAGTWGAVVSFPFLGHLDDNGIVVTDTTTFGWTPGVVDPTAKGLILLSHVSIRNPQDQALPRGIPIVLTHEMVHLLTDHNHGDGSQEEQYWSQIMNVYSEPGRRLPVWDGTSAPGTAVSNQDWQPGRLTLISATVGASILDQCVESRGSQWLHE